MSEPSSRSMELADNFMRWAQDDGREFHVKLALALDAARAEERERCAEWHDAQAEEYQATATGKLLAAFHRNCAADLRAEKIGESEERTSAREGGLTE